MRGLALPVETGDGHRAELQARIPDGASASLLWLPGMGLAARHFLPFAEAMAARGPKSVTGLPSTKSSPSSKS